MTDSPSPKSTPAKTFDPDSILGDLAKRSEELDSELRLDLPIPRWDDPELWVTYKPASFTKLDAAVRNFENAKPRERAEVLVNGQADVLIDSCVGVYAVIQGKEYSLGEDIKGDRTRFDEDLARRFKIEDTRARNIVRSLFKTDGDILATARELAQWSGYEDQQLTERIQGE